MYNVSIIVHTLLKMRCSCMFASQVVMETFVISQTKVSTENITPNEYITKI